MHTPETNHTNVSTTGGVQRRTQQQPHKHTKQALPCRRAGKASGPSANGAQQTRGSGCTHQFSGTRRLHWPNSRRPSAVDICIPHVYKALANCVSQRLENQNSCVLCAGRHVATSQLRRRSLVGQARLVFFPLRLVDFAA